MAYGSVVTKAIGAIAKKPVLGAGGGMKKASPGLSTPTKAMGGGKAPAGGGIAVPKKGPALSTPRKRKF